MKGGQIDMLEIIKELRRSNSRLHKEAVLHKHRDNEEWKQYLLDVYNPYVTYGKSGDPNGDLEDLENLKLLRSLKAGITPTTINKVYPGLIPVFQPMKAAEIGKQFSLADLNWPMIAQPKFDGQLTHTIVKDGEITHYTSNGHPWKHEANYGLINKVEEGVYIGELLGYNCRGILGDRRLAAIATTFRTNTAKGIRNRDKYSIRYFDYIPLSDFYSGVCTLPYELRLEKLYDNVTANSVTPSRVVDLDQCLDYHANITKDGFEGLVLKHPMMEWRASKKRKKDFVKFKNRKTADVYVVGEIEGTGKYEGLIGSLSITDGLGIELGYVGSGLTDYDRGNWGGFIGRVIEVEYETIHDHKLIQPTFKHIREDKTKEDCDVF
jgi:ATP-dependent DNA ligase